MSTIRKEYGSIPSSANHPGDNKRHSFREIVENELQLIKDEVHTVTNASLRLNNQALTDQDRLRRDPAAGTATIPSEVANMTKNMVGGGVLSLSGGIALYANSPKAAVSAMIIITLWGSIFGYFCLLIGRSCGMSLSGTYRECWERSVGHRGGLAVALGSTLDPLIGLFANASILSQSSKLLLEGIGIYLNVTECLLCITFVALLPLCLMKNLDALAPFSALGIAAVIGAFGCMSYRYLDIPQQLQPSFGNSNRVFSADALPFVCMIFTSFDMHFNAPRFYAELKDANTSRFAKVVGYSFGLTSMLYFLIAIVGFLTFGGNSSTYILNNYSSKDSLASLSRAAITKSLISYPLSFIGVRDNCLDILGITDEIDTDAKLNVFTIFLLAIMTISSIFKQILA